MLEMSSYKDTCNLTEYKIKSEDKHAFMCFSQSFQWLDIAYFDKNEVYAYSIITALDTWFGIFRNYNTQYQDNADHDLFSEKISNRIYIHLHDINNDFLTIHFLRFFLWLEFGRKITNKIRL